MTKHAQKWKREKYKMKKTTSLHQKVPKVQPLEDTAHVKVGGTIW